jgi:hypothetical protein
LSQTFVYNLNNKIEVPYAVGMAYKI